MTRIFLFRPLLALGLLQACGPADKLAPEPEVGVAKMAAPVEVAPEKPDFVGVVAAKTSKTVAAPFGARVLKVEVRHNQPVKKGEVLARLDDSDLRNKLQQEVANEQAALAEAGQGGANAGAACSKIRRIEDAMRKGARSGQDLTQAIADCNAARSGSGVGAARARAAREAQAIIKRQIDQAVILASSDGIVQNLKLKEGAAVNTGESLLKIADPSDLRIKFPVEKEWRKEVAYGDRVELKIDGVERPLWAAVDRINSEEAPITFSVVEADLDDSKLGPGEVQLGAEVHVRVTRRVAASTKPATTGAVR